VEEASAAAKAMADRGESEDRSRTTERGTAYSLQTPHLNPLPQGARRQKGEGGKTANGRDARSTRDRREAGGETANGRDARSTRHRRQAGTD